jgi:anti-sigma B factor antagonist
MPREKIIAQEITRDFSRVSIDRLGRAPDPGTGNDLAALDGGMAMTGTLDGKHLAQGQQAQPGSRQLNGAQAAAPRQPPPLAVVVTLPAEIDISNDGLVEDELTGALGDGLAVLVADGTRTTFCASAGVSALIRAHHQAQAAGTQLRVVTSPPVRRILELTGADQVLDAYLDLADALAGRHTPSTT